ncbi:MAG: DEAD/DEAH box helicase family protein [Burkholderiales bacterium]|nr:DEAD/DEAH box helicase family protein [Opitutaceae bacterium]
MPALPAHVLSARSWNQFAAALATLPDTTQKGHAFAHLVRHYLRTDPIYRAKLVRIWHEYDLPAELRARLKLPPRDQGIDLVAETHSGEFWAIQAKYRADSTGTITFDELATFSSLTFHRCAGAFVYALVCTTTARITAAFAGLNNLGELTAETWSTLPAEFFADLAAPAADTPAPIKPRPPRPHQIQAIERAVAHYAEPGQTRGKLIHPCGAGKSLTAYWIARELGARRVLIAVPSLALVRQTLETWMTEAVADARPVDWLCVCSDDEVADVDNEALVAHVHELGIPCDTDPAALEKHLRVAQARPGLLIVLTTYQSSPVLAQAARAAGTAFDFCVCDEAHKTTGAAFSYYAHLLHDENLPIARRLFMTATERRFASSRSDDIVSMDDPVLYGETIDLLTFKAAISAEQPILCDYRLLTIGVRESEVRGLLAENRWLDLGPDGLDEVTSLAIASLIALRRATSQYGVRHTVSFHSSILRAARFRDLCNRLNQHLASEPPVRAFHVTGKMGSAARERELDTFIATTPSLVTNARCLTEGVDVPGIDCVFFADPKGSTIDIVQASGRALRLDPKSGKQLGYILLPLVVPDGATPEVIAESNGFRFVLAVLRALAAHDERIIEWFRATSEGRIPEVGGLVKFDIGNLTAALGVSITEFAHQIEVRCWENVARLAYRPYEEAVAFALQHGLKSQGQWNAYHRTPDNKWPADIPKSPDKSYLGRGWINWGALFGTGTVSTRMKTFRSYEEARTWVHTLNIRTSAEWYLFRNGKLPDKGTLPYDIPYCPNVSFKGKGWINWAAFLPFRWRSYPEARAFAQSLKLKGQQHWKAYATGQRPDLPLFPEDIPKAPAAAYLGHGWISWGDWLGNGQIAATQRNYLPYAEARAIVHAFRFTTRREWNSFADDKTRFHANLPVRPHKTYATSGWVDWSDWLGCHVVEKPRKKRGKSYRDFASARAFVHALELGGSLNWPRYVRGEFADKPPKPPDIPASPRNVYRAEWQGWGDWHGTGNIAPVSRQFRPFAEARAFARTLGLGGAEEWRVWWRVQRPADLPSNPAATYARDGFVDWSDFLNAPPPV